MDLSCSMAPSVRAHEYAALAESLGYRRAMPYHAADERGAQAVDRLLGGRGWRVEIERIPAKRRHLAVHDHHLVGLSDRDRRHVHPDLIAFTVTGPRDSIRERLAGFEQAGIRELVYLPMGPDVARGLRAMAKVAGLA